MHQTLVGRSQVSFSTLPQTARRDRSVPDTSGQVAGEVFNLATAEDSEAPAKKGADQASDQNRTRGGARRGCGRLQQPQLRASKVF